MAEDFDDHRRIFDRGDDLQSAAAVRVVFDVDVDLSGANAVLESLSDWHRKLIEIGRARWGFTASATW
jgi:hypothetical protein